MFTWNPLVFHSCCIIAGVITFLQDSELLPYFNILPADMGKYEVIINSQQVVLVKPCAEHDVTAADEQLTVSSYLDGGQDDAGENY